MSLRTVTLKVPAQEIITRDNVPARVTAVAYYRVIDPTKSVIEIESVGVRDVADRADDAAAGAGQGRPRLVLSEREQINDHFQHIIDGQTEPWG